MSSDRLFIPPRIGSSTFEDIVYRKNRKPFSKLRKRRGSEVKVGDHIAINVAGACNGNGKSWAQSAVGVYFGPSSRHNFSEEIDEEPHTSNRAHIRAAIIGLEKVKKLLDKDKLKTSVVVVVTHSQYAVDE
ncbi:hypothetical protein AN958_09247 [Leucoagaricus sp. SymC.cos]|nr:hypothetical protein AN958_09247 [Leucoagaricus sp. SymC.cos]